MNFRLFIVILEHFGDVSYTKFIDLFFTTITGYYHGLRPHPCGIVISVNPISMTTAVFILIQTPILWIYRGTRGTTVITVPMQVPSTNRPKSRSEDIEHVE